MTGNSTLINQPNKRFVSQSILLLLILASLNAVAQETQHQLDFSSRARYADLTRGNESGEAASLLLRTAAKSRWNASLKSYLEIDAVLTTLKDQHSDGVRFNGKPVVPDTKGTELNQAWLQFTHDQMHLKLGRQAIIHDDQRFVGTNSFWQNDQTFDALNIDYEFFTGSHISYAYLTNANRIFGDGAGTRLEPNDTNYSGLSGIRPAALLGDHEHRSHLLRAKLNEWDYLSWVSYGYFIDNQDAPQSSNHTLGTRFTFNYQTGPLKYKVDANFAAQQRNEIDGKPHYQYRHFLFSLGYNSFDIGIKHERLNADGQHSFATPLGSLHEFHGWADKFSAAPETGLADTSVKLKYRHAPWKFDIRYHTFSATENNTKYGNEVDVDIIFNINKHHSILIRYADFRTHSESQPILENERRVFLNYSYHL